MSKIKLYLAVVLLHVLALAGLNLAPSMNRLAAQAERPVEVAVLPPDEAKPATKPAPESAPAHETQPEVKASPPEPAAPQVLPALALTATEPQTTPHGPLPTDMAASLHYQPLAKVLLRYDVTKGNDSAKATLTWQPQGGRYVLEYEATYFGFSVIKQISEGVLGTHSLEPERFSDKRRGRSEQATHFDVGHITFSNNHPSAKRLPLAQDRASFLIQLGSWLAAEPQRLKAGALLELPVASVDELELWTLEVLATEKLALPLAATSAAIEAIPILRRPRRGFDQTVQVWYAPALSYWPVRIRVMDASGTTDSILSSYE